MRQKLEKEVRNTKAALSKREQEEQAAAKKAKLLAEELERQHQEHSEDNQLALQVN